MRKVLAVILAFVTTSALAQSNPGLYYGQVPTAAQWNSYFAAKQDVLGYTAANKAGDTLSGKLTLPAATGSFASANFQQGVNPTVPSNGDIWATSSGLWYQYGGVSYNLVTLISAGYSGVGYGAGAGGAVTQLTSRTTGVTLNKYAGQITMFSAAGSATAATFTVTNSNVAATDVIALSQASGTNKYILLPTAVAAGSFAITFYTTGGTATDAPVINFAVVKGSNN